MDIHYCNQWVRQEIINWSINECFCNPQFRNGEDCLKLMKGGNYVNICFGKEIANNFKIKFSAALDLNSITETSKLILFLWCGKIQKFVN